MCANSDVLSLDDLDRVTCPICGAELREGNGKKECCYFCGKEEIADYICPNGHYICQECRLASPEQVSKKVVSFMSTTNPVEIAERILQHPNVPVYGVEHHYIVPLSLVAAARNAQKRKIKNTEIKMIIARAKLLPYGSCGILGDCGAAVGVGIAVSVLTHASYKSDKPRALAMRSTAETLLELAEQGGPRCCIQSVYAAIKVGAEIIYNELKIPIQKVNKPVCKFYNLAPECKKERCLYFPVDEK